MGIVKIIIRSIPALMLLLTKPCFADSLDGYDYEKMVFISYNQISEWIPEWLTMTIGQGADGISSGELNPDTYVNTNDKEPPAIFKGGFQTPTVSFESVLEGDILKIRGYLFDSWWSSTYDPSIITRYLGRWCECIFKYDCNANEWQLIGTIFHDSRQ
jgi:hypothetical protein